MADFTVSTEINSSAAVAGANAFDAAIDKIAASTQKMRAEMAAMNRDIRTATGNIKTQMDALSSATAAKGVANLDTALKGLVATLAAATAPLSATANFAAVLAGNLHTLQVAASSFVTAAANSAKIIREVGQAAGSAHKPLKTFADQYNKLDLKLSGLETSAGAIERIGTALGGLAAAAASTFNVAASLELLRKEIRAWAKVGAGFAKSVDTVNTALAKLVAGGAGSKIGIDALIRQMGRLRRAMTTGFQGIAGNLPAALTGMQAFGAAVAAINPAPVMALGTAMALASRSSRGLVVGLQRLARINLANINFAPMAASMTAALPALQAFAQAMRVLAIASAQVARTLPIVNANQNANRAAAAGPSFPSAVGIGAQAVQTAIRTINTQLARLPVAARLGIGSIGDAFRAVTAPARFLLGVLGGYPKRLGQILLTLGAFGTLLAIPRAISGFTELTDVYTSLQNRLLAVTKDQAKANVLFKDAFDIAQRGFAPIDAVAEGYARFSRILGKVGASREDIKDFTETLVLGLRQSGATAAETSSVIIQLSQALNKGKLDGDELRSFLENGGVLVDFVEKQMGKAFAQIVEDMKKGKTGLDEFVRAVIRARPGVAGFFDNATRTVEGAFVQLRNQALKTFGEISRAVNFQERIGAAIDQIREKLSDPQIGNALQGILNYFLSFVDQAALAAAGVRNLLDAIEDVAVILANPVSSLSKYIGLGGAGIDAALAADRARRAAREATPFAFDPTSAAASSIANGVAALRDELNKLPKDPLKFATEEGRLAALTTINAVSSKVQSLGTLVEQVGRSKLIQFDESQKAELFRDLATIQVAAQQIGRNKISVPISVDTEASVARLRDNFTALAARAKSEIKEIEREIASPGGAGSSELIDIKPMIEKIAELKAVVASTTDAVTALNAAMGAAQSLTGVQPNVPQGARAGAGSSIGKIKSIKTGGGGDGVIKSAKERIALLKEEIGLLNASMSGSLRIELAAKTRVEIEKAITAELRKQSPALAKNLETLIRTKAAAEEVKRTYEQWKGLGEGIGNTLADTFIEGAKNGEKFATSMKKAAAQIVELTIRTLILKPLIENMGRLGGSIGTGGGEGGIGTALNSFLTFADGGVMSNGRVQKFARGGVTSGPTYFPMANGAGLMGEAGKEAIMPLRRLANGRLGVEAGGAGGGQTYAPQISIVINGDANERTVARFRQVAREEIAGATPKIINGATRDVVRRHRSAQNFLAR